MVQLRSRTAVCVMVLLLAGPRAQGATSTIVRFETVLGNFDVRLFDTAMPRSSTNFLHYVTTDKYDGSVVHRNSDTSDPTLRDFVIQGGGFYFQQGTSSITYTQVTTIAPIADEPGGGVTGLTNVRGTIAMAKSGPNTVTSQWFINQGNNSFLDNPLRSDGGFSAFGRVLGNGMTIVDAIGDLPIPTDFGFSINAPFNDIPLRNFSGSSISQIQLANLVTIPNVSVMNFTPGDYNFDGAVNTLDYNIWKADFGSTVKAEADGNGDGVVNAADYAIWRDNRTGAAVVAAGAVPEPATITLIVAACALLGWNSAALATRHRNRQR